MDPKLRKFLDLIIIVIVTGGFSCQLYLISEEYFEYVTTTSVSIVDALPATNIPQVAFCVLWNGRAHRLSIVEAFQAQLMERPPDGSHPAGSPFLRNCKLNRHLRRYLDDEDCQMKQFLRQGKHCFSLKTRYPLNLTRRQLFSTTERGMVEYFINVMTPFTIPENASDAHIGYYIFMTSYYSDFDTGLRSPVNAFAKWSEATFVIMLSYSQKVTRLLPPPFDTDCRDYRRDGLISRDSCQKRCLNEWTIVAYNGIFDDHVVDRDKFLISTNAINQTNNWTNGTQPPRPIFSELKDDYVDERYLLQRVEKIDNTLRKWSAQNISGIATQGHVKNLVKLFLKDRDYYKYLSSIYRDVPRRLEYCKKKCRRPDCYTEYIVPSPIQMQTSHPDLSFREMIIRIFPPKETVLIVTSKQKVILLDFVVYILSCFSFWFGFCPLSCISTTSINDSLMKVKSKLHSMRSKVISQMRYLNHLVQTCPCRFKLRHRTQVHNISNPNITYRMSNNMWNRTIH